MPWPTSPPGGSVSGSQASPPGLQHQATLTPYMQGPFPPSNQPHTRTTLQQPSM